MKALITGITGQDGLILAEQLLDRGYFIVGQSRGVGHSSKRFLLELGFIGNVHFVYGSLNDFNWVSNLLKEYNFDEVYHFSSQSSVSKSLSIPYETLESNANSTLILLESIRLFSPKTKLLYACSSEIFGNNNSSPLNEFSLMKPSTIYGLSKYIGYFYVKMYREKYNLFAASAILFNHESPFRKDDFFIKKIVKNAASLVSNQSQNVYFGNLDVKRDFGYAPEYMQAVYLMMRNPIAKDYVISSGISTKLFDIVKYVFAKLDLSLDNLKVSDDFIRLDEALEVVGDSSQIRDDLGWKSQTSIYEILDILIKDELNNLD